MVEKLLNIFFDAKLRRIFDRFWELFWSIIAIRGDEQKQHSASCWTHVGTFWDTCLEMLVQGFPVFENNICLFQPGDRVKFVPTSYEEFDHVYNKIEDGSYDYNIVEYQKFSVKNYKQWLSTIDESKRF